MAGPRGPMFGSRSAAPPLPQRPSVRNGEGDQGVEEDEAEEEQEEQEEEEEEEGVVKDRGE
eukprot:3239190-Pyramimonas_sp.AAC.2